MTDIMVGKNRIQYEQVGKGPDLVLLPTLLAEMSVYDKVIDELSHFRRVTRFNFPGFGSSTGPINQNLEDYATLIYESMKVLNLPTNTDLLGNGFGGFVAVTFSIYYGNTINKLILVDTGAGFPESGMGALYNLAENAKNKGMDSIIEAALKRMFPDNFIDSNPIIVEERRMKLKEADPQLFANAALSLTGLDNRPKLKDIKNQCLIVVGLEDETTPPDLSYELHQGISKSELIELPGIGHCPQLQDPEAFLNAVLPFLQP